MIKVHFNIQKCFKLILSITIAFYVGKNVGYVYKILEEIGCSNVLEREQLSTMVETARLREQYIDFIVRAKLKKGK